MRRIIKLQSIGIISLMMLLIISCDSSDENTSSNQEVNIEEAKLSDFPLFAIQHTAIEIIDPEIEGNKEVAYGEIKITVPSSVSLDNIAASITSEELNLSKFSISPGNDAALSFEDGKAHVYTISLTTGSKEAILHYNVSIVKELPPVPETLKLTGFTFEKSKNPDLPNDIIISKRADVNVGYERIYLLVPVGTDFTNLVPTVSYEGSNLYYSQDASMSPIDMDVKFPEGDVSFDFKYPKRFFLVIKDEDNDKTQLIDVVVDVTNPVRIETASVTTPDVTEGTTGNFTALTKWVNQGNHKINFQKATTYEDISPVITPPANVITVNRTLPGGGLLPGESADVNVQVSQYFPEGTYKTTAVFYTKIFQDNGSDDLFESAKVMVTSKIIK
ncbi:hypothetical protein [Flavivirga algicola]|uniref:DUF1735 domain-containing protein n=1 Tax=Flavivirga algicola TaxID=2729136 RepID=A0ABX1S081_9FLAO|nr:hypothetical protein [Flavivirga algicola]NMH88643.1 hypothetical protein [Flavivirga algicola]